MSEELRSFVRHNRTGGHVGDIKDVAISGDLFRLERTGSNQWWICVYREGKRVAFSISSKAGRMDLKLLEDEIGCRDDEAAK